MPRAVYLLPPSEGKAPGGDPTTSLAAAWKDPATNAFASLDADRCTVIEALTTFSRRATIKARESAFKVKGPNLKAASTRNQNLFDGPVRPVIERYAGVLYDHLDAPTLTTRDRKRFHASGIILSGVFGILAPGDLIPDYKLPMDAALPRLGKLNTWWKPRLSPVLDARVTGAVVWDLLPNAHRAAWASRDTAARILTARFVEISGTREKTVSHWNKALKGSLVRHLLARNGVPEAAQDFAHEGYVFDPVRTDGDALVFSRRA